jgi:peptide/nickel transport system permease protein
MTLTGPGPSSQPEAAGAAAGGSAALLETAVEAGIPAAPEVAPRSQWQLIRRRFFKHKLAIVGLVVLLVLTGLAVFASAVTPYEVNPTLDADVLLDARKGPSGEHWFGTDKLGRDQFTRVLYAMRVSLAVGLGVALISTVIGVLLGTLAGYYGGWLDQALMRLTDLFLVIPAVAVLLLLGNKYGNTVPGVIFVLSVLSWMPMARIVRGEFLSLREKEFVEAARASGASGPRVIVRHMLPNAMGAIVVFFTLLVGLSILTESLLSFLGAGIQLPDVSLGNLIDDARDQVGTDLAYLLYFPGLVLFLIVLCVNFVGDGLRDALDPRAIR